MKRIILLCLITLTVIVLQAIDFVEGPHTKVPDPNLPRLSTASWHHNIDDQHWYGTNMWAVRFQFSNIMSITDTILFTPTIAHIYLPSITDSARVTLYSDQDGFPDEELANGIVYDMQGWTDITLNPIDLIQYPITRSVLWLVVGIPTTANGPYIAAENTGGQNSYYWNNTPGINPYFQSMSSLGYSSEFLFSLIGTYSYPNHSHEMELQSFELVGNHVTGSNLIPLFTIKNASDSTIVNAKLFLQRTTAFTENIVIDSVRIPLLQPQQTLVVDESNSSTYFAHVALSRSPSQYSFTATLDSGYDESMDYLSNNSISVDFDTFNAAPTRTLEENFFHNNFGTSLLINGAEAHFGDSRDVIINYYPNASDSLFNEDANLRYLYYDSIGYPEIAVDGIYRIHGFQAISDSVKIENAIIDANNDKTFLVEERIGEPYYEGDNIAVELEISNPFSYVFTPYLARCRLSLAIVETILDNHDIPANIFLGFVAIDDSLPSMLSYGVSHSKIYTFRSSDVNLLSTPNTSIRNCSLVYFIQNRDDNRVYLCGKRSLVNLPISNDDEEAANIVSPSIFPNPCFMNKSLRIRIPANQKIKEYRTEIYNIRGQLVYSFPKGEREKSDLSWNLKDKNGANVSSGIYFIKIEGTNANQQKLHYAKKFVLVN